MHVSCSKDILATYVVVGIYEEWNLSMKLFDAKVTSSVRKWDSSMALNPGLLSPQRESLLEWAHQSPDIRETLAADLRLYEFSLSLFLKQVHNTLDR